MCERKGCIQGTEYGLGNIKQHDSGQYFRWKKDRIQQGDYKRQKRAASKIGCFFAQLGGAYGTKSE